MMFPGFYRKRQKSAVPGKPKRIVLSNYKTTIGDIHRFGDAVLTNLGDSLFDIKDDSELIFQTLRQVYPVCTWIKKTDESILKGTKCVYNHFYKTKATLTKFDDKGSHDITVKKSVLQNYKEGVLMVDELPYEIYNFINSEVKVDLRNLGNLIKRYEEETCIKLFLLKDIFPSNHDDGIKFDFYQRCISEQKIILDYYLNKLKERIRQRMVFLPKGTFAFLRIGQEFKDFPYKFHFHPELFDYRLIRNASHRVVNFEISDSWKMEDIYLKNKALFYRKLFKNKSIEEIFSEFDYYLQHLPFKNDRRVIFNELKSLYRARRWMALFALALPQVEGLFTEMCNVAFPKQYSKSLVDKVKKVRPLYFMSESYFDYYQYTVPKVRNSFMHTGYSNNFKLQALDLIIDLNHLLHVFDELKHPTVKLKRIHTYKRFEDFTSFTQFVDYFLLLEELTKAEKIEYENSIISFERDFLIASCDADFTCIEVAESVESFVKEIGVKIEYAVDSAKIVDELNTMSLSNAKKLLNDPTFFTKFNHFCSYNYSEIEDLNNYYNFLTLYKKHLPSLKTETVDCLDKVSGIRFIQNIYSMKEICLASN